MAKLNVPVELIEQYMSYAIADYAKWTRRGEERGTSTQEESLARVVIK